MNPNARDDNLIKLDFSPASTRMGRGSLLFPGLKMMGHPSRWEYTEEEESRPTLWDRLLPARYVLIFLIGCALVAYVLVLSATDQ